MILASHTVTLFRHEPAARNPPTPSHRLSSVFGRGRWSRLACAAAAHGADAGDRVGSQRAQGRTRASPARRPSADEPQQRGPDPTAPAAGARTRPSSQQLLRRGRQPQPARRREHEDNQQQAEPGSGHLAEADAHSDVDPTDLPPQWHFGAGGGARNARRHAGAQHVGDDGRHTGSSSGSSSGGGRLTGSRSALFAGYHDDDDDYVDSGDYGGGRLVDRLNPEMAEELRRLERQYGSANRTDDSFRSRQSRLDRIMAARQSVYGARHRDADVRLLALRRELAAEGRRRRRGRFAADDALPRRSTWHKLAAGMQRTILHERCVALELALASGGAAVSGGTLSYDGARRLYLAAPQLLTDITYGVAARLRALAVAVAGTVEQAAAAISARPLLCSLRVDRLEACAAELAAWLAQGGPPQPLHRVVAALAAEPSLAAQGPTPLLARLQVLATSCRLSREGALQLLLRAPRLMALEPAAIAQRAAGMQAALSPPTAATTAATAASTPATSSASSLPSPAPRQAGGQAEGVRSIGLVRPTSAGVSGGAGGGVHVAASCPGLLLASKEQLQERLAQLQQLLALSHGQAVQVLTAQPAVALLPAAALAAAVDCLCSCLDGGSDNDSEEREEVEPAASPGGGGSSGARSGAATGTTFPQLQLQLPPPHVQGLVLRCPDVLLLKPRTATAALEALTVMAAELTAPSAPFYDVPSRAAPMSGLVNNGRSSTSTSSAATTHRGRSREQQETQGQQLGTSPRESGGQGGLEVEAAGGLQEARNAAAALVLREPRLLLCRVVPLGSEPGAALAPAGARERQRSVMSWVEALDGAQEKLSLDPMAVAAEGPYWPRPVAPSPLAHLLQGDLQESPGAAAPPGDVGELAAASARLAAAAAGAAPPPVDVGLRFAELQKLLMLQPQTGRASGSAVAPQARAWLWEHVLLPQPRLLLAPSAQLQATVAALGSWFSVSPQALAPLLLPGLVVAGPHGLPVLLPQPRPPAVKRTGQEVALPKSHVTLLTWTAEEVSAAGYRVWAWLGGAGAGGAAAADLAAVLRELPGLLHDPPTMRACALVLNALVAEAAPPAGPSGGRDELPAWVTAFATRSPAGSVSAAAGGTETLPGSRGLAGAAVPAMPPLACALLLRFSQQLLSPPLLRLLLGPGLGPGLNADLQRGGGGGHGDSWVAGSSTIAGALRQGGVIGGMQLEQVVGQLVQLLGVGSLAAVVLVLASGGAAAEQVEQVTAAGAEAQQRVLTALELTTQAGSGWARERQRFLQGSTSGPAAVAAAAGGGGEDLDAVAVAAAELLLPLQHWRRVPRMEALAAAGLREAVSYTAVLQLSEPEWEELAAEMRL